VEIYHEIWLSSHPHRTPEWLKDRLRDGFDVHHMDGDHGNNDPANLVLIECTDHMMLHGGRILRRIGPGGRKGLYRYNRKRAREARAQACYAADKARAEQAAGV